MKNPAPTSWISFARIAVVVALPLPGRAAPTVASPAPEVSVVVPGAVDGAVERGEPCRVTVRLEPSDDSPGAVTLAPAAGTWTDAIVVELVGADPGNVIARADALGNPESPRATLDREHVAGGAWVFSESVMQKVPAGEYLVRARLSITAGAGWLGDVSAEQPVSVVETSPLPEHLAQRALNRAQLAVAGNAWTDAARIADEVLATTPDDVELLSLRAEVALHAGNPLAAMICVSRAERALKSGAAGTPPLYLHEMSSKVLAAMLADQPPPAPPPAWTWPPASVMKIPADEAAKLLGSGLPDGAPPPNLGAAQPAVANTADLRIAPPAVSVPSPTPAIAVAPTTPAASVASPASASAASVGSLVPATDLSDSRIVADAAGQWGRSARAGSEYGKTQYSAAQATGAPNVSVAGNSPDAWCPAEKAKGSDWFEVTFARPVAATEVRVRQNDAAGAIAKVEAIEPDGTTHVWWEGADPYQRPAVREIAWFAVRVPRTTYLVARVKLSLNLASGPGWKQIDAVQLVGN